MARPWASQRFFLVTSAMPCSAFTRKRATQSCCPRRSGRMSANDPLFHERKSSSATTASASCRSIVRKFSRSVSKGNSVVRLSPLRRFGFFVLLRYLTPSRLSAPNSPTAPTGRRNPATQGRPISKQGFQEVVSYSEYKQRGKARQHQHPGDKASPGITQRIAQATARRTPSRCIRFALRLSLASAGRLTS